MHILLLPLTARFIAFTLAVLITVLLLIGLFVGNTPILFAIPLVPFAALTALGIYDLIQTKHAVLRNYPLTAHIRFILEEIRPEIRQYFLESEKDGTPFSRDKRAIVYQRAKQALDKRPFGTQNDVYSSGFEWLHHSMAPKPVDKQSFRVLVGGLDCAKPYSASIFNISAMSFGALSPNAVRSLNIGARKGGFAHDTGEGGISLYHRENGGDLIWEIGSGYFSCRNGDGTFCAEKFADRDQAQSRRQARPWRSAAGGQGIAGNRRHPRRRRRHRLYFAGTPFSVFDADRDDGIYRALARTIRRQADRVQALRRASVGVYGAVQGDARDGDLPRLHRH
jgi:hypothetical protein